MMRTVESYVLGAICIVLALPALFMLWLAMLREQRDPWVGEEFDGRA